MTIKTENILIFGPTGLVGKYITSSILDNKSRFGKVAVFTSPNTLRTKSEEIDSLKSRGAQVIVGDITSDADVNEAAKGFDTVVSCIGRGALHTQPHLVQILDEHPDVKRFFPSEYGTDVEYGPASANEPPHQNKLKVRAALKDVKDLEYTCVVVGPFGDAEDALYLSANKPENEAAGTFNCKRKRAVLLGDGNGRVSLTTMRDVGKLVAAALLHPEQSRNKALRVNSFTSTPKEILAEFERQTGGQSWDVAYTSLDKLKEFEKEAYASGNPRAPAFTLRRIWTEGGTLYDKRDNHLIGMEEGVDTLQTAVEQAVEIQSRSEQRL